MTDRSTLGGVIHTYQRYDPKRFPSPTATPPDLVSPIFEHMLAFGSLRELSDEELARAIHLDPSQIQGLGPSLDALREMMDFEQVKRYMVDDIIEVVPLAYMRGRTLNNAFIILDEAQNTTVAQMKMFLTRMGWNSKVVVSGDTSQVDLPPHTKSGLIDAVGRLRNIEGYASVVLTKSDIVRHRLVQEIVRAYEEGPKKKR